MSAKFVFIALLNILLLSSVSAQEKIIEYKSNILRTTEELGTDIKILTDSVEFFHEGSFMYCDSAQFNPAENYFKAFGNIKIIKPPDENAEEETVEEQDTVFAYGDSLTYSGQSKIALLRNNVILTKDSLTLTTDSLDYNLNTNVGYYPNHGVTVNGEDTLESKFGYYYADDNKLFFKDSVVVKNPRFTLYSDTLEHHTKKKISYIFGPTEIISDSNYIYSEKGQYNHELDNAELSKNAFLQNQENTMSGDSIFYDRKAGYGEAFRNTVIRDTLQNLLLVGNYGRYNELEDKSLMTDSAVFIQVNAPGDSLFLHADTLLAVNDTAKITFIDESGTEQTKDSLYRVVKAFHNAKIYKIDLQAIADSITYNFKDSISELHYNPVVWSEEHQLTADKIILYTQNESISKVEMLENAFVCSQIDSLRYNQIKGKKMIGYIDDEELYRVDVIESGKTLYYVRDEAEKFIGINLIECVNIVVYLKDQKIDKIWFYTKPKGEMHPPLTLANEKRFLKDFLWRSKERPKEKSDIFVKNTKKSDSPE